jgi:hypothetical protein
MNESSAVQLNNVVQIIDTGISYEIYQKFQNGTGCDLIIYKGFDFNFLLDVENSIGYLVSEYGVDVKKLDGTLESIYYLERELARIHNFSERVRFNIAGDWFARPFVSYKVFGALLLYCGNILKKYCKGQLLMRKLSDFYGSRYESTLLYNKPYFPVLVDSRGREHIFWGLITGNIEGHLDNSLHFQMEMLISNANSSKP